MRENTLTGMFPDATFPCYGISGKGTASGSPYNFEGFEGYSPEYYELPTTSRRVFNPNSTQPDPNNPFKEIYREYSSSELDALPVGTSVPLTYDIALAESDRTNKASWWGVIDKEPGTGRTVIKPDPSGRYYEYFSRLRESKNPWSALELDFSNSKLNGKAANFPNDFHGQGFSIVTDNGGSCASIIFDATLPVGEGKSLTGDITAASFMAPATKTFYSSFVVGIKDVKNSDELENAIYQGLKTATSNWDVSTVVASNQDLPLTNERTRILGQYGLYISKYGNKVVISRHETGGQSDSNVGGKMIFYNGTVGIPASAIGTLPPSDDTVPSGDDTTPGGQDTTPGGDDTVPGGDDTTPGGQDTTPGGEDTTPGGDDTVPGGDTIPGGDDTVPGGDTVPGSDTVHGGDTVPSIRAECDCLPEMIERFEGNPLVIHTGPKANQRLYIYIKCMKSEAMGLKGIGVETREKALASLDKLDFALEYALNEATQMGAYQMRLNQTVENLTVRHENTIASDSVITDADMAKEMTSYVKYNVLAQSAQAMLAQANQKRESILSLLQ